MLPRCFVCNCADSMPRGCPQPSQPPLLHIHTKAPSHQSNFVCQFSRYIYSGLSFERVKFSTILACTTSLSQARSSLPQSPPTIHSAEEEHADQPTATLPIYSSPTPTEPPTKSHTLPAKCQPLRPPLSYVSPASSGTKFTPTSSAATSSGIPFASASPVHP